jgi:hypothetical protein
MFAAFLALSDMLFTPSPGAPLALRLIDTGRVILPLLWLAAFWRTP